jgi:hypothetical protein
VNERLWTKHLTERLFAYKREVAQLRRDVYTQRMRAEYWRHRALKKAKR